MRNDRNRRYPRCRRNVDVAHFRRHPAALAERSRRDLITVVRAGKPILVLMHWDWFRDLKERAGEQIPRIGKMQRRSAARWSAGTA